MTSLPPLPSTAVTPDTTGVGDALRPPDKVGKAATRNTLWFTASKGSGEFMRLLSNLILTRLLVPEAFGLMAVTQLFVTAIAMFADLGTTQALVQHKRGTDERFINTAWTLQALRGVGIWAVGCLIGPIFAHTTDEPMLALLLPVAGFTAVFKGLQSTGITLNQRSLNLPRQVVFDLGITLLSLLITVVWAWITPTVWALVGGTLISQALRTVLSYHWFKGVKHRFLLDKQAIRDQMSIGRWTLVSTALTFLAIKSDRLVMAHLVPMSLVGVYQIAYMLTDSPRTFLKQMGNQVVFPVVARRQDLERRLLRKRISEKRGRPLAVMAVGVAMLTVWGDQLVHALWDPRYADAGWMCSVMAVGLWVAVLRNSIAPALRGIGRLSDMAAANLSAVLWLVLVVFVGYRTLGIYGYILMLALLDMPSYVMTAWGLSKEGLFDARQDLGLTLVYASVVLVGMALRLALGMGLPYTPA